MGLGVHEDIDFTNFTQQPVRLNFEIEIDADFADQSETSRRRQHGQLRKRWRTLSKAARELRFDYHAKHQYSHQGNRGTAQLKRSLMVHVEHSGSAPSYRNGSLRFSFSLKPRASWHACIKFIPVFDGTRMLPLYGCREFSERTMSLIAGGRFISPNQLSLNHRRIHPRRHRDLGLTSGQGRSRRTLRLPDLDQMSAPGDGSWIADLVALFGRDTSDRELAGSIGFDRDDARRAQRNAQMARQSRK